MIHQLRLRFLLIRLWVFDKLCSLLFLENAKNTTLKRTESALTNMKEYVDFLLEKIEQYKVTVKTQEDKIKSLDRDNSLEVRSSLELLDFSGMGEIIWIKVADDRMLRHDVFNQIRDWMRSHGKEHSILIATGTNVTFDSLTEQDLVNAQLKRMTPEEREQVEPVDFT